MDSHKLKVFCAVAETRSFSEASRILNLTQPAVSLQIQALERSFETGLFDRSDKALKLTPSGELLYSYAKKILSLCVEMEEEMSALIGQIKEELSIGASSTVGNYLLPHVIVAFRKRHPKVRINLKVGNTKEVVKLLHVGEITLGFVEGDVSKENLVVEKLASDELVLIMPRDHPWSKRKSIPVTELAHEPLIVREVGSGTRQIVEKRLHEHHISMHDLNVTMVLGDTEAIKTAVEQGMGVAIVSVWTIRKEARHGTIRAARFSDIRFNRDLRVISHRSNSQSRAATAFLDYVKRYPLESPVTFPADHKRP